MLTMEKDDPLKLNDPLDFGTPVLDLEISPVESELVVDPPVALDIESTVSNGVQETDIMEQEYSSVNFNEESKTAKKQLMTQSANKSNILEIPSDESIISLSETREINNKSGQKRFRLKREEYLKKYKLIKERRSFKCDLCDKAFITASRLKEHNLNHCRCFPCKACGKTFRNLRSLQRHVAAGHVTGVRFEAKVYDKREDTLLNNFKGGSTEVLSGCKKYYDQLKSERRYQCKICQKTFITISHLNTHMNSHSGKKWKCDGCGKNFSCERSLTRHRDTFPGEHWFPCHFCDMNFFRVINIIKHLEIKHPEASMEAKRSGELNLFWVGNNEKENESSEGAIEGRKICICTICLKVFESSEKLKTHKEAAHSLKHQGSNEEVKNHEPNNLLEITRYKCDVCDKEFISLEGFEYHKNNQHIVKRMKKKKAKSIMSHSFANDREEEGKQPVQTFSCKICVEGFPSKSMLQIHIKSHNQVKIGEVKSGMHQCCICPKSFASSDGLKYHLATHTGERRYSCVHCGKKFIKKTHLFEHVATHSKVRYFKCSQCPRTFSTHSAYRKHMKHFPNPHSFPCSKCGKLFTKESMLEKHMCVDLVKVTMAPEVKALLSTDGALEDSILYSTSQGTLPASQKASEAKALKENNDNILDEDSNSADHSESGSHSCYKCFKVFPSLDLLQTHQNDHIGKQQYQCRFCPQNFKRANDFSSHIRNHLGSTPYMCLKCNRKFISPLTLSMHAKKYPGDHSFTCRKCQRWFPSEKRLDKHECILQNADRFTCACGTSVKSWKEFAQHAGTKPYACCSCNLKYLTLVALARHIKKHTGVKPFSCEVCGKSFRAKNNYMNHKNIHKETKEIICEHCPFQTKSKKRMDFHLFRKHAIGSNISSTLCPICGIIFPYITQMKKHIEVEHSTELVLEESKEDKKTLAVVLCTLCGKLLSNKYMLANHMKKVHNPDAPRNAQGYECNVCEEKFRKKKELEKHMEVHEVPGLRICELCNEEFYYARDLKKHMKKHDGNKPYSCKKCGKTFKVSVSLKYHSTICGNGHNGLRLPIANIGENYQASHMEGNIYSGHIDPSESKNPPYIVVYKS